MKTGNDRQHTLMLYTRVVEAVSRQTEQRKGPQSIEQLTNLDQLRDLLDAQERLRNELLEDLDYDDANDTAA